MTSIWVESTTWPATSLPPAHRYAGQPYGWHLVSIPGHTIEHASQIRQFVNDRRRGA